MDEAFGRQKTMGKTMDAIEEENPFEADAACQPDSDQGPAEDLSLESGIPPQESNIIEAEENMETSRQFVDSPSLRNMSVLSP